MIRFTATVEVAAPVDRVWSRITDWPSHGRYIPLTTVTVNGAGPDGVGALFTGRTALGPLGFDDPMEVVVWSPPAGGGAGRCEVVKHGRVVLGRAWFEVVPRAAAGSTLRWTEEVQVVPVRLTRPFDRLVAVGGRLGFERALGRMARDIEAEAAASG